MNLLEPNKKQHRQFLVSLSFNTQHRPSSRVHMQKKTPALQRDALNRLVSVFFSLAQTYGSQNERLISPRWLTLGFPLPSKQQFATFVTLGSCRYRRTRNMDAFHLASLLTNLSPKNTSKKSPQKQTNPNPSGRLGVGPPMSFTGSRKRRIPNPKPRTSSRALRENRQMGVPLFGVGSRFFCW